MRCWIGNWRICTSNKFAAKMVVDRFDLVENLLKRTGNFDGKHAQDWKFRVGTNMKAVLLEGAVILKMPGSASAKPPMRRWWKASLDANVDKVLSFLLAAARKSEAVGIVSDVSGAF